MSDVDNDIVNTKSVLDRNFDNNRYSYLFFKSNEDLRSLFHYLDVKDKKVLSVLGSGDQAFYFYDRGCKSVDLFDINKLAFYYYYIRLWTIKYLNQFYPNLNVNADFFRMLLSFVECKSDDEKKAFDYWTKFVDVYSDYDFRLLFSCLNEEFNDIDLEGLKKTLNSVSHTFYNCDISCDNNIKFIYDIVYISNITGWIESSDEVYRELCNKLYLLLNDDGIVVCSNVNSLQLAGVEQDIFKEAFDCYSIPSYYRSSSPGYYYTKKKF